MNILFPFMNSMNKESISVKDIARISKYKKKILFLAFLALSMNLRAPITALPPVVGTLRDNFEISAGTVGLLTSIPVLCFGILTVPIGIIMKRFSVETSVFATLFGIIVGSIVRSSGGLTMALIGTIIIGVALTVGNIAGLMVIGRDYKSHLSVMTGVYVSGMSIGAMVTTALTAPFAEWIGWRMSLVFSAEIAFATAVLWGYAASLTKLEKSVVERIKPGAIRETKAEGATLNEVGFGSLRKKPIIWLLAAAFAAHTFIFYGMTAWLPDYLTEVLKMTDSQAGYAASLFQILGLLGCFGIPFLASTKRFSNNALFAVVTVSWTIMPVGIMLFPSLWLLWIIFGAIGSGGGFTVIFSLVMRHASNLDENRMMSAFVQSVGYIFASASPVVVGQIYHITENWNYCFLMLTATAVFMAFCGMYASREKK